MSGPFGSSQWMYSSGEFYEFPIEQSLKFNDDDTSYLSWTPASAGNRKTWTWSGWVKRCKLGQLQFLFQQGADANNATSFRINSDDTLEYDHADAGSTTYQAKTSAVFRDTSAWYHIVLAQNTTEATASDRIKIYVNGVDQSFSSSTYPSQNFDADVNTTNLFRISGQVSATLFPLDAYIAEVNFIDGQALDPTSFGEFKSGVWIPKDPSGLTYGTNGFRLSFQNDTVSEGFNTVTYRGAGVQQSINGVGFAPDLVWVKNRDTTNWHNLYDSVRGATKELFSNATNAETTTANSLLSFDADGFTVGAPNDSTNKSGSGIVAWCWDAGSGSPVSNTDGSITSTVKANPDYGFSIVNYTGTGSSATVGHGLGKKPSLIFIKRRAESSNWAVAGSVLGSTATLYLNLTNAQETYADPAIINTQTTTTFSIGTDTNRNKNTFEHIAYCFADVEGYSKAGSYTGNGSTSGPTITTGFKPAFVMTKRTDSADDWAIFDNTRGAVSGSTPFLVPNNSNVESTYQTLDFTDTGFQITNTDGKFNASGGTYIYIAFADTRDNAFWRDQSGNGNDWQPNNLTYQDSLPDSTTNNFATWNSTVGSTATSEGNLKLDIASVANSSTIATNEQNVYAEILLKQQVNSQQYVGVAQHPIPAGTELGTSATSWMLIIQGNVSNGQPYTNSTTGTSLTTFATGDIAQIAYNPTSGKVWFGKNGTWLNSGDPVAGTGEVFSGISGDISIAAWNASTAGGQLVANFGQDSSFAGNKPAQGNTDDNDVGDFYYAPPSGYLALCTANLPDPTIDPAQDDVPNDYFNTVLYTGNGLNSANALPITGVGFQPDWVWIKSRSDAYIHVLQDAVRGTGYFLQSNSSAGNQATGGGDVSSFDTDGFTISYANNRTNSVGSTYAAWNWLAGNGTSSNTDGSITSTVNVNQKAGFSIVKWAGDATNATIGHGLGAAPSWVLVKRYDRDGDAWRSYHAPLGPTKFLEIFNTDAAQTSAVGAWNDTAPTSSVFTIGSGLNNGGDIIAYCFAEVEGYSKFGSYVGNSSTDGPFVYTGFEVAWLLVKNTSTGASAWVLVDNARDPYNRGSNGSVNFLFPHLSNAEDTAGSGFDLVSNGFKLKQPGTSINNSGDTFIYMAFAANPFKYATAR